MIIESIIQKGRDTAKSQASSIFHGRHCKCTIIHLPKSTILPSHISATQALLVVMSGSVVFTTENKSFVLNSLSDILIEPNLLHDLKANEDSTCILIQEVS